MGNSQERRQQLLQYEPHLVNYTLHHNHTPLSIYRQLYSSQQIMEHREIIYHFQDIDRKLQTFYSRYQHLFLVSTKYLKLQAQNACSDGAYEMRTFYERVITNLSKVNDIPFNDSLYCYSVALKGFEILFKNYGYFQVFQNMFHICQQGKLKVWCNQHIYKSVPQQYLLGNGKQSDMVMKVISIIDQNTQHSGHNVNIKQILMRLRPLNFATAKAKFMEICSQNQFYVSQYLQSLQQSAHIQSILDIYAEYSAKTIKTMQPFDTGLTFNPKKTSKSNVVNPLSHDNSMRRASLQSSRMKNHEIPSQRENSYEHINKKGRRLQILNAAMINENKQYGFPNFTSNEGKSGRKSSCNEQNIKNQSQVYEKMVSPMKYQNNQGQFHQVTLSNFGNSHSPQSRLKKTSSRQTGPIPERILFQSNVNELKEDQLKRGFRMPQKNNSLNRPPSQLAQDTRHFQNQTAQQQDVNPPQRVNSVQQREVIRSYSQNNANRGGQSLRSSQTKTIRVNTQPHYIQQPFQQKSLQIHPHLQRPLTPQPANFSQNNNYVYPIYPVQKVVFQAQAQSSRLKKLTKIQPTITFSQQKSETSMYGNSQVFFRQSLPAYIQHQKRAQMQVNNQSFRPAPVIIQRPEANHTKMYTQQANSPIKVPNQNVLRTSGEIRQIQLRQNNLKSNNIKPNMGIRQQQIKVQPINRKSESLPNKISNYEKSQPYYSENVVSFQQIQPFRYQNVQKTQNINNRKYEHVPLGYMTYQKIQPPNEEKKDDKMQLPQLQSKIDMLSSFAQNKITTYEFLPNQSHAISGIKWQKGENSGRDSVSSAFRKELFPQTNTIRQFQKKSSAVQEKYLDLKPKKPETAINTGDHDYLQTDPKLLELIKSATTNYRKQLTKTLSTEETKQIKLAQQYSKKDTIKEYTNKETKYQQSRFKTVAEKTESKPNFSSFGGNNKEVGNTYPNKNLGKTQMAFKKKAEPYMSGNNKIPAITEKWDQQNICSTSNGSIGKNYLQNLDADILQDMKAYGMDGGKGKFKQK